MKTIIKRKQYISLIFQFLNIFLLYSSSLQEIFFSLQHQYTQRWFRRMIQHKFLILVDHKCWKGNKTWIYIFLNRNYNGSEKLKQRGARHFRTQHGSIAQSEDDVPWQGPKKKKNFETDVLWRMLTSDLLIPWTW